MSKTALRVAGISLVAAFACGLAGSANAQLLARKDISAATALTMAEKIWDAFLEVRSSGPAGSPVPEVNSLRAR